MHCNDFITSCRMPILSRSWIGHLWQAPFSQVAQIYETSTIAQYRRFSPFDQRYCLVSNARTLLSFNTWRRSKSSATIPSNRWIFTYCESKFSHHLFQCRQGKWNLGKEKTFLNYTRGAKWKRCQQSRNETNFSFIEANWRNKDERTDSFLPSLMSCFAIPLSRSICFSFRLTYCFILSRWVFNCWKLKKKSLNFFNWKKYLNEIFVLPLPRVAVTLNRNESVKQSTANQ